MSVPSPLLAQPSDGESCEAEGPEGGERAENDAPAVDAEEESSVREIASGSDGEGDESKGTDIDEDEHAKADRHWHQYLSRDNSLVTDVFGGQLQSCVTCSVCQKRFTT
jgi:hypothetical protein